jgi:thymidylate synthase
MFILADTLDDLLRRVLNQIAESGVSIEASRGSNRELAGVLLKLTNPRARLSHTETKGKVFSPLGELAWYLSASDNADFITYYLQRYRDETESDGTIHGAYGPRMFTAEWHNQFEQAGGDPAFRLRRLGWHVQGHPLHMYLPVHDPERAP